MKTINQHQATLLVLAGGLGSRYKGAKQVDSMGPSGEYLMEYGIYDAVKAGFTQLVLTGNDYFTDDIKDHFKKVADEAGLELYFIAQTLKTFLPAHHQDKLEGREKPWGTAHATLCVQEVIHNPFVVINADDYYGRHAFAKAMNLIKSGKIDDGHYGTLLFPINKTLSENGTVARGLCTVKDGYLESVVEHTKIGKEDGQIIWNNPNGPKEVIPSDTLVSMNFWLASPSIFKVIEKKFDTFLANLSEPKEEIYLPSVINEMIQDRQLKVSCEIAEDQWFGVTYPEDKINAVSSIKKMTEAGYYPARLW